MYKFGQIKIASKDFNSVYQIANDADCEKIRVSEGVVANKHDTRYTIGYEVEPGKIVPLCIKTPKECLSSGVTRYSESSPWKMVFNFGGDEAWVRRYEAVWKKVEELLGERLTGEPLSSEKYVNPKLITWDSRIRTAFRGSSPEPRDIGSCLATGVLKIGSLYRQGSGYHLQVFLKECKYRERDVIFKSLLSDDEDEGCDAV